MQRGWQFISLGAGVLGAGYVLRRFRATKPLQPVLLPTLGDLRGHEQRLKELFKANNADNYLLHESFERMLYAIEKNNPHYAEEYLRDLLKRSEMTEQIKEGIVAYAANFGKVDMLSFLQAIFGAKAVKCYPVFNEFNVIPCSSIKAISKTLSEVYDTRGLIGFENLQICLEITQEKLREQNADCETKINYTRIMDMQDLEFKQKYTNLISEWKQEVITTKQSVVGTVVLKSRIHTSLLHIKIDANDKQDADAQILHFSSTGHVPRPVSLQEDFFQVPMELFAKVDFELAEDRLQRNHSGCTLFTLYFYETLMNFDRLMMFNNQYSYAGESNAIFLYAKDHHTYHFNYGKGQSAHLFSMPVAMTVGKQFNDYPVKNNNPSRTKEFDNPADLETMRTVNQVFSEVKVPHRYDDMHNLHVDHMRYDLGFRLSQKLSLFSKRRDELEVQYSQVKRRY